MKQLRHHENAVRASFGHCAGSMRSGTAFTIMVILGLLGTLNEAWAAQYYVDPASGSDSASGTSQSAPWRTIPGTRTTNNSGWLRSAWGSITSSNQIKAGDIIEVKAGTSMTSASGGRLEINSTYYQNGTAASPIVIRVSPTWGSGNFTYNASGMTIPTYFPAIYITQRNYIQVRGADATRRFAVTNAGGGGRGIMAAGTSGAHQQGVMLDFMEMANNSNFGSSIYYSDNWTISNSISHNNGSLGFDTGGLNDANANNGLYLNDEAYSNGVGGAGIAHGFGLYGSTNITFSACKAHDNGRDGFDFGSTANANSASATVVNSSSYNNGEDGFGANGGTSGGPWAFNYVNVVSFDNGTSGFQIYDAPTVGIYHSILHNNGGGSFAGNILTYSDPGFAPPNITLRNNIFYKPGSFQIGSYNSPGGTPIISSNYNIYVPRTSNTENGFDFPWGTTRTYTNPPSFIGPNDKLGIAYDPGFVSVSSTNFASNNYHLSSGSGPAINAGVALTSVTYTDKDRDGNLRNAPPEKGPYEYGSVVPPTLAAPTNLRVVP